MANKQQPLKILSVPVDRGGCGNYRIRQPFQAINDYTSSDAHVIDKENDDMIEVSEALCNADILVVRQGGEAGVPLLAEAANMYAKETKQKGFHAKIVLDIDDNIELISPYSEHYGEYGTRDFYDNNINEWLWKDNKTNNFNLVKNRAKVMSFLYGMQKADLVTVTTEKLAEYARQYNKNVAVTPNVINEKVWWKPNFVRPNKPLRIGWTGGHSHYEDWYSIKEPLNRLLRKYQFTLVMAGTGFEGLIDEDLRHLVEVLPWVSFEAHSYRTMLLNLDLAIIPLSDSPFNNYKSAIKYFEFSATGVPSVVANVTPYKQVIDEERALPYKDANEFTSQLEKAITQPLLREKLGNNAHDYVLRNWTTKVWAQKYVDNFYAIL